jgi:hypothetical protein
MRLDHLGETLAWPFLASQRLVGFGVELDGLGIHGWSMDCAEMEVKPEARLAAMLREVISTSMSRPRLITSLLSAFASGRSPGRRGPGRGCQLGCSDRTKSAFFGLV